MLNAIVSSTYSTLADVGNSTGSLEAQVDQYKIKLADWANCPSCKTPEGKAKIADISNKIRDIQARIKKIEVTQSNSSSTALDVRTPANITMNKGTLASGALSNGAVEIVSASGSTTATIGSILNVFA
jgi:hypothetical protein